VKHITKLVTVAALIAVLALAALPVFAQATPVREVIITEEQVNQSYRVTNPRWTSVTNMVVDLQPGQAAISATITFRGLEPIQTVTVMVPTIVNNRLNWAAASVTGNGQPVSDELLAQINSVIASSWIRYFKTQAGTGRIENITITDYEAILSIAPAPIAPVSSGR